MATARAIARWAAGAAVAGFIGVHGVQGDEAAGAVDLILVTAFVVGGGFWILTSEPSLRALPHRRPKLAADNPTNWGFGWMSKHDGKDVLRGLDVLGIPIYNTRDGGPSSATARNVVAKVEAFDEAGERVADPTNGHWWGAPDAPGTILQIEPQKVDFEPTHQRRSLAVAVRQADRPIESVECHLACPWLAASEMKGGHLPPGTYRIDVSLRGENLRGAARFEYELRNPADPEGKPVLRAVTRRFPRRKILGPPSVVQAAPPEPLAETSEADRHPREEEPNAAPIKIRVEPKESIVVPPDGQTEAIVAVLIDNEHPDDLPGVVMNFEVPANVGLLKCFSDGSPDSIGEVSQAPGSDTH